MLKHSPWISAALLSCIGLLAGCPEKVAPPRDTYTYEVSLDASVALPEGIDQCLNRKDLEAWLRNAPAEKAMAAGEAPSPHSRGMNNFNLTEDQIDDFVAFLITLQ